MQAARIVLLHAYGLRIDPKEHRQLSAYPWHCPIAGSKGKSLISRKR